MTDLSPRTWYTDGCGPECSCDEVAGKWLPLADVLALGPGSHATWDEAEAEIRARLCLCCGEVGHYQAQLDAHVAANGLDGLAIYIDNEGRIDGHHRVVAARKFGVYRIPVESQEQAGQRWFRAHGAVDWHGRKSGDITHSEASWVVTAGLMALAGTPYNGSDETQVTA